jgi:hypothetical protein
LKDSELTMIVETPFDFLWNHEMSLPRTIGTALVR